MKDYFIRLFDYDKYASLLILKTIISANNPEKPVKLMAHMLAAQQIWLNRCKGLPAIGVELWPNWPTDKFSDMINENHNNWIRYLNELNSKDFERIVTYKSLKGDPFENKLTDILAHVINHGTHHRAQAGQHILAAGIELPNTDYIYYLRST
jgi:uncharacterized damage-inducible protein DinB